MSVRAALADAAEEARAAAARFRRAIDFKAAALLPADPLLIRLREELVHQLQFGSFAALLASELAARSHCIPPPLRFARAFVFTFSSLYCARAFLFIPPSFSLYLRLFQP